MVTAHQEGEWVARAAQAGASAFIPKGGPLAELITILQEARPGPMRLAPSVLSAGASANQNDELAEQLTPRELQVLRHVGKRLSRRHRVHRQAVLRREQLDPGGQPLIGKVSGRKRSSSVMRPCPSAASA